MSERIHYDWLWMVRTLQLGEGSGIFFSEDNVTANFSISNFQAVSFRLAANTGKLLSQAPSSAVERGGSEEWLGFKICVPMTNKYTIATKLCTRQFMTRYIGMVCVSHAVVKQVVALRSKVHWGWHWVHCKDRRWMLNAPPLAQEHKEINKHTVCVCVCVWKGGVS
jgi:hypothetical protein